MRSHTLEIGVHRWELWRDAGLDFKDVTGFPDCAFAPSPKPKLPPGLTAEEYKQELANS